MALEPAIKPVGMFRYAKPGSYTTALSPDDESQFQNWVKQNNVNWDPGPTSDYDMRGYWKATNGALPSHYSTFTNSYHFPDTWKTPYHSGFSNESIYAKPNAPHWEGDLLLDEKGNIVKNEVGRSPGTLPDPRMMTAPLNLQQQLLMQLLRR